MEIWSGGQTGVDRAALDVALELGIVHGGWVPAGRRAEDGAIPARYDRLRETESADYAERTERNVRDTDGTLLLSFGPLAGGSLFTWEIARRLGRPCLHIDLDATPTSALLVQKLTGWLRSLPLDGRLNVAGPRASGHPEAHARAMALLHMVFDRRVGLPNPPGSP